MTHLEYYEMVTEMIAQKRPLSEFVKVHTEHFDKAPTSELSTMYLNAIQQQEELDSEPSYQQSYDPPSYDSYGSSY